MLKRRRRRRSSEVVEVPIDFVRDLTRSMLDQIAGDNHESARNQVAARLAESLSAHEFSGMAHLQVAKVIADELVGDEVRAPGEDKALTFDVDSGALCWSAVETARVIGVDRKLLVGWRRKSFGPHHIKVGEAKNHSVIYPITGVFEWLAERDADTALELNERTKSTAA